MKKTLRFAKSIIAIAAIAISFGLILPKAEAQEVWEQNGSHIYYNGGNVGIGTSSPAAALHVNIPEDSGSVLFGPNNGVQSNFRFLNKYHGWYNWIQVGVDKYDTDARIRFSRMFGGNLAEFHVDADKIDLGIGKVKIGPASVEPTEQLYVEGNAEINGPYLRIKDNNPHLSIVDSSTPDIDWFFRNQNGYLKFYINGNTTAMTIDSTNKIGIGSEVPSEKLEVNGNIKLSGNIVSDGDICIGNCD